MALVPPPLAHARQAREAERLGAELRAELAQQEGLQLGPELRKAQAQLAELQGVRAQLDDARQQLLEMDRCAGVGGGLLMQGSRRAKGARAGPEAAGAGADTPPTAVSMRSCCRRQCGDMRPACTHRARAEARRVSSQLQQVTRERDAARGELVSASAQLCELAAAKTQLQRAEGLLADSERAREAARSAAAEAGRQVDRLRAQVVSEGLWCTYAGARAGVRRAANGAVDAPDAQPRLAVRLGADPAAMPRPA